MSGGLGKAELEFVASLTAPIYWLSGSPPGKTMRNGSVFFQDTGQSVFAVTANHVVQRCISDSGNGPSIPCLIGGNPRALEIDLRKRLIAANSEIDIATIAISREEVARSGHTVLTGCQRSWPPPPPQLERGVTYCGFPGRARERLNAKETVFGIFGSAGIVSSLSDTSISVQIMREDLFRVLGDGTFNERFDFGGISGGPLLTIVQTSTLRLWMPGGVVIQGPNPTEDAAESIAGFEVIKARPIQFIKDDGTLDVDKWAALHMR